MSFKSITLHRPEVDNSGAFRDSGTRVIVGDKPDQISEERAKEIHAQHGAVGHHDIPGAAEVAPPPPPAPVPVVAEDDDKQPKKVKE